jgi:16S rRNA (guanine966-N2)-methyltransferase
VRQKNTLRIIGGEYGGRRLNFPDGRGLRPTADRVRETLFNWLQGKVHGCKALDLFSGSGALGIEALSRGAAQVVFVDKARATTQCLRENLQLLQATQRSQVQTVDALSYLQKTDQQFDLVFLDPPFADGLLPKICQSLDGLNCLAETAWIYMEQDSQQAWPELPDNWQPYREGQAGQARFCLVHKLVTHIPR